LTSIHCHHELVRQLTVSINSNVVNDWSIPDPHLTELGREQALSLSKTYPKLFDNADVILSSPLKRTIETALLGFPKLGEGRIPVELLPDL